MKITIFSPYSFVKQWRLTDLYLAECLKNKENNIIFLECEGYQKFCVAMLCANLHWKSDEEKKLDICNDCRSFTKFTKNHTDAIHLSLDSFLKAEDEQKISSLLDKDVIDIKYQKNNIRIGKACLYSLMIEHQLTTSKEVKEKLNNEFRQEVKTGLRTVFAAERFFVKHKPDILILHNGLYATGNILSQVASQFSCEVYTHINGSNRHKFNTSIRIAKNNYYDQIRALKKIFLKHKIEANSKEKKEIKKHLQVLIEKKSPFCFSEKKAKKLPIWLNRKIGKRPVALMTLSSYDELIGATQLGYKQSCNKKMFKDQIDWVLKTMLIFKKMKKYFLVIRPHPREFPHLRTRSKEPTAHVKKLIYNVNKCEQSNVFLNLPDQKISLYNLISKARLVINGWSTAGEEAGLLGKNVLTSFPEYANYPIEKRARPINKKDYKNKIQSFLTISKNIKNDNSFLTKWRILSVSKCETETPNFLDLYEKFNNPQKSFIKILKKIAPNLAFFICCKLKYKKNKNSKIEKLINSKKNFLFE